MKVQQPILLLVIVFFYLLLTSSSKAFSLLPAPPVQPPPVVNTPPSLLQPGGTTEVPNTPWALCQSLPQSCIVGGPINSAPQLGFGSQSCPIGSILISNQCVQTAYPGTTTTAPGSPNTSGGAPSSNGCLPGELAEDNLCIRAQSTPKSPQLQQQQSQPQQQSRCPQGTILENNLCFPQQQVPTANFTSQNQQVPTTNFSHPSQQPETPTRSNHNSATVVSNLKSAQSNGNGTRIEKKSVSCNIANQTGSDCNTNSSVYQSASGKLSTNKSNNGLAHGLAPAIPSVRNHTKTKS
jgi:hypothetical protein